MIQSEPEASDSKTVNISKSKYPKSKVVNYSESNTSEIQIRKILKPKSKVLMNLKCRVLKPKVQIRKTIVVTRDTKTKGVKPKVLNEHKPQIFKHEVQKKTKPFSTNSKGPIKIWYLSLKFLMLQICLRGKEKQRSWYLDSGCSRHMT